MCASIPCTDAINCWKIGSSKFPSDEKEHSDQVDTVAATVDFLFDGLENNFKEDSPHPVYCLILCAALLAPTTGCDVFTNNDPSHNFRF